MTESRSRVRAPSLSGFFGRYPPERYTYLRWSASNPLMPSCNALIFWDLDTLTPTRDALSHLYGLDDLVLISPAGALERTNEAGVFELQRGAEYEVRATDDGIALLRRTYRIQELLAAVGEVQVRDISTAFYGAVFADHEQPQFRALFASQTSETNAARNQADWFVQVWGGDELYTSGRGLAADELIRHMLQKHPGHIMSFQHAQRWLHHMRGAVHTVLVKDPRARESVMRYLLHFLSFFEFSPVERRQLTNIVWHGSAIHRHRISSL